MLIRRTVWVAAAALALTAGGARGAEWCVSPDGDDASGGAGWSSPFATVGRGVAAAADGDTVLVSNGTYRFAVPVVVTNAILVRSWRDGGTDRDGTVLDGGGSGRVLRVDHPGARIDGLTLANGYAATNDGAGLLLSAGLVSDCRIISCVATSACRGGGAMLTGGILSNCLVASNGSFSPADSSRGYGGGIYMLGGEIRDCRIAGNVASWYGGGVYAGGGSGSGCVFSNNSAAYGAGLFFHQGLSFEACLFVANTASAYGGAAFLNTPGVTLAGCTMVWNRVTAGFGGALSAKSGLITNCVIRENSGGAAGIYIWSRSAWVSNGPTIVDCAVTANAGTTGGGISQEEGSRPALLERCLVAGNRADSPGGDHAGVYVIGSARGCVITGNVARRHYAGLRLAGGTAEHCIVADNISSGYYAGAVVHNGTLRNSLVTRNRAPGANNYWAGLHLSGTSAAESCTVLANAAADYAGIYVSPIASTGSLVNTIAFDNLTRDLATNGAAVSVRHCCIPGLRHGADGNITNPPRFQAGADLPCKLEAGSPCIDAGTNLAWMAGATDLAGGRRISRLLADIGACEFRFNLGSGGIILLR